MLAAGERQLGLGDLPGHPGAHLRGLALGRPERVEEPLGGVDVPVEQRRDRGGHLQAVGIGERVHPGEQRPGDLGVVRRPVVVAARHRELAELGVQRRGQVGRELPERERLLGVRAPGVHVARVLRDDRRPQQQGTGQGGARLRGSHVRQSGRGVLGLHGDVDGVRDEAPGAGRHLALEHQVAEPPEVGPRHPAEVDHQDAGGVLRRGVQPLGHVPPRQHLGCRVADGEDPGLVARDGPEAAQQRHHPCHQLAVVHGEPVAQHVGEVVLLPHEDVDAGHLVLG